MARPLTMTEPSSVPNRERIEPTLRSLVSRAGLVTIGNLAFAALGFVSNWLLARSLGGGDFGVMARALAAFAICQELLGKGICWALVRIASQRERARGELGRAEAVAVARGLHSRWGLALLAVYLPCAVAAAPWSQDALPHEWVALAAAGASAWFMNFSAHALAVCQISEDWAGYARLTVLGAGIRLVGYGGLWALSSLSIPTALAAHVLTSALTAALSLRHAENRIATRGRVGGADPLLRKELAKYSTPIVVATTVGTLATQVDVFLVSCFRANTTVAHFRVAALIITALELVIVAAIVVLAPGAGRAFSRGERRRALARSTGLAGLVGALALATWPLASWIVWPFGPDYAAAADLYVVMLIGTVLNALTHPLSVSFFSEDRPGRFVWLHGASLVFLVVADLIVLPAYGALGAAWVRVGMRALQAVVILAYLAVDLRSDSDPN